MVGTITYNVLGAVISAVHTSAGEQSCRHSQFV